MITFTKNPNEQIDLTYDGTAKLVRGGTPAEVFSSGPVANLLSGSDGLLTVGAPSINSSQVFGTATDGPVAIGCGISFVISGGTPGRTYYIDVSATTNLGNIRGDRVAVFVAY